MQQGFARAAVESNGAAVARDCRAVMGWKGSYGHGELRAMAVNIIGLGLIVAAVILMIMGGVVGWIIGVICLIGGVGALFMTWQRRRRSVT